MANNSLARIKFASLELRWSQSGYSATAFYRVPKTIAGTAFSAFSAPGIPSKFSQLIMPDGAKVDCFAKEFSVRNPPETEGVWEVQIEYGEIQPRKFLSNQSKYIDWSLGMTSIHQDVSVNGKWVGSRVGWNAAGSDVVVPHVVLPEVEIGYEALVSTFEFQIRSPRSIAWDATVVNSLRGHVNRGTVVLMDGARPHTFPAGMLLFSGATANPLGTGEYAVAYNFVAGYRRVEGNLPIYIDDTSTLAPENSTRIIPMRYGLWPRYQAVQAPDADGKMQVINQTAVAWSRFVALPDENFVQLRI